LQILLVEDTPVNQQLAVRLLEKRGHFVTVASNGQEALTVLKRSTFDLVLMDVQMPVMDGFQATASIRQEEASTGKHLRIVAMTAHAMQGDRERCLDAGMDAYISKPIQADELAEIVESGTAQAPDKETAEVVTVQIFDHAEALKRVEGDKDLLMRLAGAFLQDAPRRVAEIRASILRGDVSGVERAAHSVKGQVAYFAARTTSAAAAALEKTAHGGDLSECGRLFADLEERLDALRPELLRLGTERG
jgi:two-component system, sensor histidine kinase and response regulator